MKSDGAKEETPCTPGWCGEGHGAKCFNAGRCLREQARKAAARKSKPAALSQHPGEGEKA
jgi:hypothetical protein